MASRANNAGCVAYKPMPELEIWLCPVHESLDNNGRLRPLDNCVACIRVQRDELLAENDRLKKLLQGER